MTKYLESFSPEICGIFRQARNAADEKVTIKGAELRRAQEEKTGIWKALEQPVVVAALHGMKAVVQRETSRKNVGDFAVILPDQRADPGEIPDIYIHCHAPSYRLAVKQLDRKSVV